VTVAASAEERTRLAIETCAFRLFVERGYCGTTIDDIADRAKVAPSIITRHFETKEAMLTALHDRKLLSAMDAAVLFTEAGINPTNETSDGGLHV